MRARSAGGDFARLAGLMDEGGMRSRSSAEPTVWTLQLTPRLAAPSEIGAKATALLTCSSAVVRDDLIDREESMILAGGAASAARFGVCHACGRPRGAQRRAGPGSHEGRD